MANLHPTGLQGDNTETTTQDRGLFGLGKKEHGGHGGDVHVPATEAQQKPSIFNKTRRSGNSSSSSSDEEVEENGVQVRRPKNKGITEKIKEKLPGGHKNEAETPVGLGDYMHKTEGAHPEEKKGFIENAREKLPGKQQDEYVVSSTVPPHGAAAHGTAAHGAAAHGAHETPEKKGVFDKIKDIMPGGHKDGADKANKGY